MQIHTLFTGIANTHIVEDGHSVVVIDAGMPRQARRIVNKIRALGHSPQDVRLILLTHGHIDHAGSAAALQRLTGAPIALHRADARLTATRDLSIPPGRNAKTDAVGRTIAKFGWIVPLETFTPDVWLDDGMSLRDLGIDARVVHTPGHTNGSVSVTFEDGTVFVGDAILNLLHVSFPLFWENAAAARASACRIRSLQPRVCYSGHGRPFDLNALDEFVADHCG
jgi:hydroxyacylglutathione hydrolase